MCLVSETFLNLMSLDFRPVGESGAGLEKRNIVLSFSSPSHIHHHRECGAGGGIRTLGSRKRQRVSSPPQWSGLCYPGIHMALSDNGSSGHVPGIK